MALPAIPVGLAALLAKILARGAQTGARAPGKFNAPTAIFGRGPAAQNAAITTAMGVPAAVTGIESGTPGYGSALASRVSGPAPARSEAPLGSRSTMEGFMPPEPLPEARERRYQFDETNEAAPFMRFLTSPSYEEPGFSGEQGKILEQALKRTRGPANVPLPPVRRPEPGPSVSSLWDRYNETGSPADFVRADRAMRDAGYYDQPVERKAGGAVGGNDVALQQAMEIIQQLLSRGR